MKERYLGPKEVAEQLGIAVSTARARMQEMPGCVNVGGKSSQVLRVPESGLEAWISNRTVMMPRSSCRLARRKNGKLIAV